MHSNHSLLLVADNSSNLGTTVPLKILISNFLFEYFRMIEDKNCIGSRVDCEGHRGTVKYVGTVGNTKGQWLGIDWDDPIRGKHNGTYDGVEYFQTWYLYCFIV